MLCICYFLDDIIIISAVKGILKIEDHVENQEKRDIDFDIRFIRM
jgi:hypothetical protein